jgi:putative DNA primase/helicase
MSYTVSRMLQRGSEMLPKPVDWVWEGLVPMGKLTLITGDPGVGRVWWLCMWRRW